MDNPLQFPQNMKIGLVPMDGGEPPLDQHRARPDASSRWPALRRPSGKRTTRLLAAAEDRGDTHLYRLGIDGRDPERLTSGPVSIQGFDVRDGVVATIRSTVEHGGELWLTSDDGDCASPT